MAKKGAPTLFNPKPSRPTLPKKESPAANTPSPGSSQSLPNTQSQPETPKKPPVATASPRPGPPRPAPLRRPPVKTEDETAPQMPEGPFSEYRLVSSKLNGWKYDIMKFDSRKKVEINDWAKPVKLNRKDMHRDDSAAQGPKQAVAPMVGSDGKLVIGADGKVVMVDAQGKVVRDADAAAAAAAAAADDKGKEKGKGKKKFQKKTRQVFMIPEETRQLRREEKYPWVIEDAQKTEVWTAQMEEVAKSQTYAMFMPAAGDVFKFVPAHRWYKFRKQPSHHIIRDLNAIENYMSKAQKLNARTLSSLVAKTEEAAASGSSLVHNVGQSRGPGGRKLRTVDSGPSDLFGDDEEEGVDSKRRVKRELGQEGFLDELDFEESFADDEEKMEADDKEDDETKELEERLKREYKTANKLREGYIDESESESEDEAKLTGAGKNLQKTLKKLEKGGGYEDSDDEKNPYASSEEEEEEEEPPQAPTGPAILPPEPKPGTQRSASQTPSTGAPPGAKVNGQAPISVKTEIQSQSRATSPVPNHGGHSIVAKRATSPKMPKPKTGIPSRAGSPLASPNGASPPASRATSPVAANGAAVSPGGKLLKRKATEEGTTTATDGAPRPKKRKAPAGELEDRMVIDWLRNTPNATTRECIQHFTKYLTDEAKKSKFTALVKEVAQLSGGVLILRPAYRGTAPSPAPTPAAA
ncbi:Rap30/74 interaction domain-containing protein [Lentinus tigrinus ALCF2SS1-7]|uniref:Rap30/74 interaction domain-containing protein n=1 Tax=Lentinus tigrinus ALCF2SS1-6 TaxID=1328759 RepID=A0A5C2STA9_9APHY|nr:Rap30/74 interaction domain-containing protein [Lentinus tigrinus ALCF2SS1-6]RPD81078.1 Rap30/74 interaction domain-containing protein [Lentinus tigrinus ALCF2SS1-7]